MWVDEVTTSSDMITEEAVRESATSIVPQGSVLCVVRSGILARRFPVSITRRDVAINQDLKALLPSKIIDPNYLFYFMRAAETIVLASVTTGATVHRVSTDFLKGLEIPVPPLEEQRRIVAALHEAFAAIAIATANAEKNLANARELFGSIVADKMVGSGQSVAKARYPTKKLGDLCHIARGGSPRPIQSYLTNAPDGINWIKISDATASDKYIEFTKQKIRPEGLKKSRLVKPGDFLLSNSMSFGRPYIMKTTGCIHDGWLVLSDKSGLFDRDYLYHFLGSDAAYCQFDDLAAGSTVRNLNSDLVKTVEVPLPPLEEQRQIVAELDLASSNTSSLAATYSDKLFKLTAFKQSLLHRAFTGEPTAISRTPVPA